MYNNFLVEIYAGLSWDLKWHKQKYIYNEDNQSNTSLKVLSLPSEENFLEMLRIKTSRLFGLAIDIYISILDESESNKGIN